MASKPGERKLQILQALANMLQTPDSAKITTAALARQVGVSEAALYRHFASKGQMYSGLIDFIETSLFSVINQIQSDQASGLKQAEMIVALLLGFAQKNRGLTRVLIGDAVVHEEVRLQQRMSALLDKVESALRQAYRVAAAARELPPEPEVGARANVAMCYVIGKWQSFVRSGFVREPLVQWRDQWPLIGG